MKEIRDLLSVDHILTNDELRYLLFLFRLMYEIEEDIPLEINNESKYSLSYDINGDKITINWTLLIDTLDKDNIKYANYSLSFLLLHELNHALQKRRIEKKDDYISQVYRVCFSFLESCPIALVTELKQMIYDEGHDLFPTEINADICGYISILKILKDFDNEAYEVYKGYLKNRLINLYKDDSLNYFFERILRIKEIDYSYPTYECLLFGLPILDEVKEQDIMKLIK